MINLREYSHARPPSRSHWPLGADRCISISPLRPHHNAPIHVHRFFPLVDHTFFDHFREFDAICPYSYPSSNAQYDTRYTIPYPYTLSIAIRSDTIRVRDLRTTGEAPRDGGVLGAGGCSIICRSLISQTPRL